MKTISKTRNCVGYLSLVIALLVGADRYYPAVLSALGFGADELVETQCRV